jgi:hypothetical protein
MGEVMKRLSAYIATGFAAALAVSLWGSEAVLSSANLPAASTTVARKGDALKPRAPIAQTQKVSTVELVGVQDVTVVLRSADGRVLYRNDQANSLTVVSKGVVLPQVTIREGAQGSDPGASPAAVRPPHELPEGCDPAFSSLAPMSASRIGMRCIALRDEPVRVAALLD